MYSREYFKGAKQEVVERGIKYRFLPSGRVWVQTARPGTDRVQTGGYPAGYRQEPQENTLMSKVCPSKAGIQIWAPTPSPRNGAVEAGTLGKHLHQP